MSHSETENLRREAKVSRSGPNLESTPWLLIRPENGGQGLPSGTANTSEGTLKGARANCALGRRWPPAAMSDGPNKPSGHVLMEDPPRLWRTKLGRLGRTQMGQGGRGHLRRSGGIFRLSIHNPSLICRTFVCPIRTLYFSDTFKTRYYSIRSQPRQYFILFWSHTLHTSWIACRFVSRCYLIYTHAIFPSVIYYHASTNVCRWRAMSSRRGRTQVMSISKKKKIQIAQLRGFPPGDLRRLGYVISRVQGIS